MYYFNYCVGCGSKISDSEEKKNAKIICPNCKAVYLYTVSDDRVQLQILSEEES